MGNLQGAQGPSKRSSLDAGAKTGRLVMEKMELEAIPAEVWLMSGKLRSLDVSFNKISQLTSQVGSLSKLQSLKLSHNLLRELPAELSFLLELKSLAVDVNLLEVVPALPKGLKMLDLSSNRFEGHVGRPNLAIPISVIFCSLAKNRISGFNVAFGFEMLQQLEELDLDDNYISQLPEAIGELKKLLCLKLRNNQIAYVPSELFVKTNLNRLHLEGNPLTIEILRGTPGFELFMERRKERISKAISQGLHPDTSICGLVG